MAINYLVINEHLHTAGQPDAEQLAGLADEEFEMVINIAPPTSRGSIQNEGGIVSASGLAYVNIPVDWNNPTYADFELFSGVLTSAGERKVLVHCQANMRVSMFVFLYRTIVQQVAAPEAYEYVTRIWEPGDQWIEFGRMVLDKHNIKFDL